MIRILAGYLTILGGARYTGGGGRGWVGESRVIHEVIRWVISRALAAWDPPNPKGFDTT